MTDLEGKKLLILGANPETTPLVEIANSLGVKTLVTSSVPNDHAKKSAWKSFDVDGMDVPGLVALAKEQNVDGVLVGVADVLVPSYCKVCDALNFPCYGNQHISDIFSFKDIFKATCEKYGIHGIPEYYLDSNLRQEDINKIKFPVVVKPVDSSSGTGMTVCYNQDELEPAVKKALDASKKKRFIVERYMNCDDVGMYFTFKDGQCSISCLFDRYTCNEQVGVSKVNLGSVYPSKHKDDYFMRVHDNMIRMFKDIGIKNGVLLISAFFENGEFYVYDPGFRLQGEAPHLLMKAIHGFDQREMLIRFALTGSMGNVDLLKQDDFNFKGKSACTLWFLLKAGKIKTITGLDKIKDDCRVVENIQRLKEGDEVLPQWVGTEKQVMTRLYIVCDTPKLLADAITEYRKSISVVDDNGNNMLINGFDINKIF